MKLLKFFASIIVIAAFSACGNENKTDEPKQETSVSPDSNGFAYAVDQFYDLRILRYQVPGFEQLTLQQKTLLYYLSQAALAGKDIAWDQNYKYNLTVRKRLKRLFPLIKAIKTQMNGKSSCSMQSAFGFLTEFTTTIPASNLCRSVLIHLLQSL